MRQKTYERLEKAWNRLPDDHRFESKEQFFEELSFFGEVSGEGEDYWYSRQRSSEPYGPENIVLIKIQHESDWDKVLHPAI